MRKKLHAAQMEFKKKNIALLQESQKNKNGNKLFHYSDCFTGPANLQPFFPCSVLNSGIW